jgi:hypothetical protein
LFSVWYSLLLFPVRCVKSLPYLLPSTLKIRGARHMAVQVRYRYPFSVFLEFLVHFWILHNYAFLFAHLEPNSLFLCPSLTRHRGDSSIEIRFVEKFNGFVSMFKNDVFWEKLTFAIFLSFESKILIENLSESSEDQKQCFGYLCLNSRRHLPFSFYFNRPAQEGPFI